MNSLLICAKLKGLKQEPCYLLSILGVSNLGWVLTRDSSRGCGQWLDWGRMFSGELTYTCLEVGAGRQLGLVVSSV